MRIINRKTGEEITEGQEPELWPPAPPTNPPVPAPEPDDNE